MTLLTQYEAYKRLRESLKEESSRSTLEPAQVELPEYGNGDDESESENSGPGAVRNNARTSPSRGNEDSQKSYEINRATGGHVIEADNSEIFKTISALDFGVLSGALNAVNNVGNLVSHLQDSFEGFKNMSPSEIAMNLVQRLNSLTGGDINKIRQQLNPQFMWENLGSGNEAAEKLEDYDFNQLGRFINDYKDLRENIRSIPTDYFWIATIKPPFRTKSLIKDGELLEDIEGRSLSMLLTEFKYTRAKVNTTQLRISQGVNIEFPSSMVPEYNIELTILDSGDNLFRQIINKYYDAYKDPYGKGVPLPWEWYFDIEFRMFMPDRLNGSLIPFHEFHLQCVPSEGTEVYEGTSSPDTSSSNSVTMSVIGFDPGDETDETNKSGNASKIWQ